MDFCTRFNAVGSAVALHDTILTVNRDGQTALHHAGIFTAIDIDDKAYSLYMYYIKQLVAYGQQSLPSIKDINGDSATDIALRSGLGATAKVLLKVIQSKYVLDKICVYIFGIDSLSIVSAWIPL